MTAPARRLPSAASRVLRLVIMAAALPLVTGMLLGAAMVVGDSNRLPSELANSSRRTAVQYCSEGRIVHGEDSWLDRFTQVGRFVCTAWRSRGGETDPATGAVNWPTSPRR
jgi:hypothetical protein